MSIMTQIIFGCDYNQQNTLNTYLNFRSFLTYTNLKAHVKTPTFPGKVV